jgi:hypothetical protein
MEITIEVSGGFATFPRLNAPVTIDTEKMAEPVADELESALKKARFFDLPTSIGEEAPGSADIMTYTITAKAENLSHTVRIIDPITDPSLQHLVEQILAISHVSRP